MIIVFILLKEASDPDVRKVAEEVYQTWKKELERRVESEKNRIPVRSDLVS